MRVLVLGLAWALACCATVGCSSGSGLPDPGGRLQQPPCSEAAGPFAPLSTRCQHFVDADGRVVMLHGVNARVQGVFDVTFDDGRAALEPIPTFGAQDAARMRQMGFDLLRLPIDWSGIEPTDTDPPTYDTAYLDRVQQVVDLCRQVGLFVLLDFHQDAYSKEIGEDGAPLWAIQPPPTQLLQGPLTDLGTRRASQQVRDAFTTFWGGAHPGPMLRSRFASMAAAVAQRFAGDDAVVGIEVFNEPVFESDAQLLSFTEQVAGAIRAADPQRLVVFEPDSALRAILDKSNVLVSPFPLGGAAYAPHVYTLAFFGSAQQRMTFTIDTLRPGNESAYEEAMAYGTPLLITEFGYDPNGIRARDYLDDEVDLHDEYEASDAFWVWKEQSQGSWGMFDYDGATGSWTERPLVRGALSRPMPERIAGWPRWWRYDRASMRLDLVYDGDDAITAPTEIYVPAPEDFSASYDVSCDGTEVTAARDPATGLVDVGCAGAGPHVVVVQGH